MINKPHQTVRAVVDGGRWMEPLRRLVGAASGSSQLRVPLAAVLCVLCVYLEHDTHIAYM